MKRIFSVFFAILTAQSVFSQTGDLAAVVDNIHAQTLIFPQEKLYLQTDKPYYVSGEKLFFRTFLLEASSNRPSGLSRYVYVELINPADSVVIRQQIRVEKNLFYGALLLPEYMPQGDYRLRAYTRFMENLGEESFYSRPVYISDPCGIDTKLDADFTFMEKNKIGVSLRFSNRKTGNTFLPENVIFRLNSGKSEVVKPNKSEETIDVAFTIPEKSTQRILLVESVQNGKRFGQYLHIPDKQEKLSLALYPEGGYLIPGKANRVAFKAGLPDENITGKITDKQGNTVTEFSIHHEGMGDFFFQPKENETYTAVLGYGNDTLKVELPAANPQAKTIAALWNRNRLNVKINRTDDSSKEKIYLIIHHCGRVIHSCEWDNTKEYMLFDKKDFPSGVSRLLLMDRDFRILSERPVFVNNPEDCLTATVKIEKNVYRKREKVKMNIDIPGVLPSDSTSANLALSITDDKDVVLDTTTNIIAEILLASELKGYVRNPAAYFQSGRTENDADLLMLVQGWNRYPIPEAIGENHKLPTILPEVFQSLSGEVRGGILEKPYRGANITISTSPYDFIEALESDEKGRFRLDNFEFPDSTKYLIQAFKEKGSDKLLLLLDSIVYPEVKAFNHFQTGQQILLPEKVEEYIAKSDWKYSLENGMRLITLPEVVIRDKNPKAKKVKTVLGFEPDKAYVISEEEYLHTASPNPLSLLRKLPGVRVDPDESVYLNKSLGSSLIGSAKSVLFYVDGVRAEHGIKDVKDRVITSDIAQINVISGGKRSVYGYGAEGGVIEIYTYFGMGVFPESKPKYNYTVIKPLGYQKPIEFYSSVYDTTESLNNPNPDLRSTIYWKPDVTINAADKSAVEFYTADAPSSYSVVIEGITDEGTLIYQRKAGIMKVE